MLAVENGQRTLVGGVRVIKGSSMLAVEDGQGAIVRVGRPFKRSVDLIVVNCLGVHRHHWDKGQVVSTKITRRVD